MTTSSKVAVIGLGNIGQAVAGNLAKSNTPFIAADRNTEKAKELSEKWNAQASDIPGAVKNADIIVLAIPFGTIGGFMKDYAADLEGKIIVDPSNPIAPEEGGGFKKIIGEKESAGEINATFLPQHAKLVKVLGTLGAGTLSQAAFQTPEKAVLFYATDDTSIDPQVEKLINDSGFDALRIGGINQSIRIEVFGDLHEFGALGKPVTLSEAKQKI
ncbi:NADP oxidoreductase coenzyme F420-dependent [Chryseobacterium sp. T16E-39]|uniref:NADPH-dependent F420 reductase n=1 Tax=Chryseobacterium sp. T16E-39 TaxID=2015076 RepID=UPI000B5B1A88|nr:NAD(P)-binding domain-containing protein [Chryseobacterium sp. T16E-39]ASK29191.1 NADP oxidoreductase coenzyme F420-dependent [Chryseobacterium sp. T16E-39]